ncbi:aminodeoxychorismate synthase component I [Colwellia sp. Arc7-635]|uniref:aminodeoxychorismate synthase component I n=1 Tax=Colwellia sp. Arc7-635 TaxID=2497879 RepID=UPI000F85B5A1|nr:aminodeoxychorismate synthase component I [Colwellia sp. Arc7-635]AZQ83519.1 aminodeoxychorismate synthase component I [Colwellia sp. Arc7-635]
MPNHSLKQLSAELLSLDVRFDSQSLFTTLAEQPWAMWLDSCESEHVDSRYDIIVWQPSITLTTLGDMTTVKNRLDNSQYQSDEDPLLLLKREQSTYFSTINLCSNDLPFKGGAVGYFAYDLGKRFEVIQQKNNKDIAIPEMAIGIYQQAVIYDRKLEQCWLLCLDDQRDALIDFFQHALIKNNPLSEKSRQTNAPQHFSEPSFKLTTPWQSNMQPAQYREKFKHVHDYLLSGDCYQINLAQRFTAQYTGNEYQAYCALRKANKAPFSAFLRFENSAILSISPERFLQLNGNKVQSKPIKGTRPRSSDAVRDQANADELQQASKDRAENLMIVDLLRNDISRVCIPGTVTVPALFNIESFPAVHHLVSTVEGEIKPEYDGSDLLRASFPGGSITGAPKIRAMDIIEELEPNQRSIYCGSIGYLSACGNMDTSITIRTLVCQNKQIHCWAGGGIVADSNVDSEYQETYDKVNKILPILSKLNLDS